MAEEVHQMGIIIEWLSDAHDDNMADPLPSSGIVQEQLHSHNLFGNLSRRQIAALGEQAAGAEAAADIAADLRCHADGQAKFMLHQHRLDQISVPKDGTGT